MLGVSTCCGNASAPRWIIQAVGHGDALGLVIAHELGHVLLPAQKTIAERHYAGPQRHQRDGSENIQRAGVPNSTYVAIPN
jgi:hypothetical protein